MSPAGSHKPNTAVPQAYYNKVAGTRRLATETGPGSGARPCPSPAACSAHGLHRVHGAGELRRQALPGHPHPLLRGRGLPSPSDKTRSGRAALAENPDNPGSLGLAISEAVEDAATHADTNYALGSVLNT